MIKILKSVKTRNFVVKITLLVKLQSNKRYEKIEEPYDILFHVSKHNVNIDVHLDMKFSKIRTLTGLTQPLTPTPTPLCLFAFHPHPSLPFLKKNSEYALQLSQSNMNYV